MKWTMNKTLTLAARLLLVLSAAAAAAGCQTINEKRMIDYKTTRTLPPLDIPPDLSIPPQADVPATAPPAETATFSKFTAAKNAGAGAPAAAGVLPEFPDVRLARDGQVRWLVVKAAPESLWPRVREFVLNNGLLIDKENPQTGVIETDWAENRAKVGTTGQTMLAKWLGTAYSTDVRDKFRIRLERGAAPGTTEIYLSHRGMEETVTAGVTPADAGKIMWRSRPSDPELEAELLRLLLVHLGRSEEQARAAVAPAAPQQPVERARLGRSGQSAFLSLEDSLDRAWRRIGLSLDRIGFTIEDRDRSRGIYYVRYIDPDRPEQKQGFFSRMLGGEEKKPGEQFQIHLKPADAGTAVEVLDKDGAPEASKTGERILSLLYEQLK